jgi:hypothetical protein
MRQTKFYTPEMATGCTRWFQDGEEWPKLDWSKVTAIESFEHLSRDQFKAKYPLIEFPE